MKNTPNQAMYDAYTLGQEAACSRVPLTDNPYVNESYELYAEWVRGWIVEDTDQREHEAAMDRQRARCY
jgi:hypothetical protein